MQEQQKQPLPAKHQSWDSPLYTPIKKKKKYHPQREIILNADYDLGAASFVSDSALWLGAPVLFKGLSGYKY